MVFFDPVNDVAFKKLFGDRNKKEILISFLNSVLERSEGERIVDVTFNDPYNYPETQNMKLSIVDVSATDERNNHYIIEMQVAPQPDYGTRAQYYTALAAGRQLGVGGKYQQLKPVIFVGVLGEEFELFSGKHYLSHHLVLDTQNKVNELKLMEWHFVELSKFNLELDQLQNIIEKWAYLLKNAKNFHDIPKTFEKTEPLNQACQALNQAVWNELEIYEYEKKRDEIMSALSQIEGAEAKGEVKGEEIGKRKQALAIAQAMLAENFDIAIIARVTKLPIEEIEALKKKFGS